MKNKNYICPVCGYDGLEQSPKKSYEICPCCGYEFGTCEYYCNSNYSVDVGYEFNYKEDEKFYSYVRELWVKRGCNWFRKEKMPKNWNLEEQLKNLQLPEVQKIIEEMTKKYTDMHNSFLKKKDKY